MRNQQVTMHEGSLVERTRAFAKLLTSLLALVAIAFALGLAWGALRAGVSIAERWLGA